MISIYNFIQIQSDAERYVNNLSNG